MAQAVCPRAEHAGSPVRFDGRYGKPGHRRQLYRCTPQDGDRPHRFTELLPREEAWHDACEVCERGVHLHEGPHAARHHQFVARGIAETLRAVGAGATYRQAALVARERAGRLRADPDTGELRLTRHGQLVMDWVEVFAPLVFEAHRPRSWPVTGSLLLDDLPFSVRDPATGRFRIAFKVFCAVGFELDRPKLWRIQAFPEATQANWEAFLRGLEGAPVRVVCDNHSGLNAAVKAAFPQAELYLCEWHLRHALERLMDKIQRSEPEHRAAIDALAPRVEAAFTGPSFWRPFVRDAQAAEIGRLSSWLESTGRIVEDQFARRGLRATRGADMPLSTSHGRPGHAHPRRPSPPPLWPQEPGAHQPAAAAHAAARQPTRRSARLHQGHSSLAGGQRRPPAGRSPRGQGPPRPALAALTVPIPLRTLC